MIFCIIIKIHGVFMINVLHIAHNLALTSGITTVLKNYFPYIDKSTFHFDFATFEKWDIPTADDYFKSEGSQVFELTRPSLLGASKFVNELAKVLKEQNYQIVHLHDPIFQMLVKKAIKKSKKKIKFAVHSHNSQLSSKFFSRIRNKFLIIGVNKNADIKLACSDLAGKCLFGNHKFDIIKNGINVENFKFDAEIRNQMREKYNIKNELVVVHSGRFCKEKNHNKLIDVFNALTKKVDCRLFLLGEGPLIDNYVEKVKNLGLSDKVEFVGYTNKSKDYFCMSDVLVLPSLNEGLSLVLIEAQYNGLPCVASNACSKMSKISNKFSFMPLKESNEKWADEIIRLTKTTNRETMDCDNSFKIENCVSTLEDIYKESLNG